MADILPGIPSVPGDETTWTAFVDQFETLKKGDIPLSLTNWDTGSAQPAVEAGSALEIAGATYRFTSEQEIDDEAGVAAGTVYVVVKTNDPNVNSATPYFSSVAPIWRADLNGWYDAGGANRYTGHFMIWDGGSSYTDKSSMYGPPTPYLNIGGSLDVTSNTTVGGDLSVIGEIKSSSIVDVSTNKDYIDFDITTGEHIFPRGNIIGYAESQVQLNATAYISNLVSGTWRAFWAYSTTQSSYGNFSFFSDGTNYKLLKIINSDLLTVRYIVSRP